VVCMQIYLKARGILLTVVLLLAIVFGFAFVSRTISGTNLPIAAVQSGSMEPTIPTGSLLFIQKASGADIAAGTPPRGDVVIYFFPDEKITDYFLFTVYDPLPWSHRAIQKIESNGTYYFLTKGDANMFPDQNPNMPATWVPEDRIIGKVTFYIPYLGYPFLWFKNIWVITAVILILIVLILIPSKEKSETPETDISKTIPPKSPETQ